MDKFSGLPDDLLVKILSFVPTQVAVSTCVLSKRWKFLWMWLSKLDYPDCSVYPALVEFLNKNLPLHRAPVIESLHLCLPNPQCKSEDIKLWVEAAVSRYVRELEMVECSDNSENIFPASLFACRSFVILRLRYVTLVDVPSTVCLSSLETLQLEDVIYGDEESFQALVSGCPFLEDLSVDFGDESDYYSMRGFNIIVPSLQKLSLYISDYWNSLDGYEIRTPSLKYLKLEDWNKRPHFSLFHNMPELKEAYVDGGSVRLILLIGPITSVNHLTICSEEQDVYYGDGFVFKQLEHLKLHVCRKDFSNLLARLLKGSPNLRVLDIDCRGDYKYVYSRNDTVWNQPTCVPECMLSSLQILNWSRYFARRQDRDMAVYILENAPHLRKATFCADRWEKAKMVKQLTLSSLASSTCEVVFCLRTP